MSCWKLHQNYQGCSMSLKIIISLYLRKASYLNICTFSILIDFAYIWFPLSGYNFCNFLSNLLSLGFCSFKFFFFFCISQVFYVCPCNSHNLYSLSCPLQCDFYFCGSFHLYFMCFQGFQPAFSFLNPLSHHI